MLPHSQASRIKLRLLIPTLSSASAFLLVD
jgi:hypothetical protein